MKVIYNTNNIVQVLNPRSNRWVKVNITKATLTPKKSVGPWKNIPINVERKSVKDLAFVNPDSGGNFRPPKDLYKKGLKNTLSLLNV